MGRYYLILATAVIFIVSANCLEPISSDSFALWRRKSYYFFTYQSKDINVSEWLSIFTLCLAPLVTHILVGAPDLVVLRNPQPRWTDRVCHFNPTSIYWRYYVITCRRACSMSWNPADMAASNAAFWTGRDSKWDGSEMMLMESRAFCTRLPRKARISLMSASAVQTILVVLQGIQATYDLIRGFHYGVYTLTMALPTIFYPLAVFGLFRLPAALWLTNEYGYADVDFRGERMEGLSLLTVQSEAASTSSNARLLSHLESLITLKRQPQHRWRIALVTFIFLAPLAGYIVLGGLYFAPNGPGNHISTATSTLTNVFYIFFLSITFVTALVHILRGQNNTTILPSISSLWYKLYTYFLGLFLLVYLVIASLETRRTFCGQYTTFPAELEMDKFICSLNQTNPL